MPSLNHKKIAAMRMGGHALHQVKKDLEKFAKPGVSFEEIEAEAQRLIKAANCTPSFSTVEGYHWATCITKNEGLCHGIPRGGVVESGDVITIDVGLICQGFHLDTSITFPVGKISGEAQHFLEVGQQALHKAINKVKVGASVYDISRAMEETVEKAGFGAVYQLTGHGVGEELHMDPMIPCVAQKSDKRIKLYEGQTIAVEIMYAMGNPYLVLGSDEWTYETEDGSLTGMFEESVLVTSKGPEILT